MCAALVMCSNVFALGSHFGSNHFGTSQLVHGSPRASPKKGSPESPLGRRASGGVRTRGTLEVCCATEDSLINVGGVRDGEVR